MMLTESELQKKIDGFCNICDFYKAGTPCRIVGQDKQVTYTQRNWCGWARYQKAKVNVTREDLTFYYPQGRKKTVLREDKAGLAEAVQEHSRVYDEHGNERKSPKLVSINPIT